MCYSRQEQHKANGPGFMNDFSYKGFFVSDNPDTELFCSSEKQPRFYTEIEGEGIWAFTKAEMKDSINDRLNA